MNMQSNLRKYAITTESKSISNIDLRNLLECKVIQNAACEEPRHCIQQLSGNSKNLLGNRDHILYLKPD